MTTDLNSKTIGQTICQYRKYRGIKAVELAACLGLKEQAYTKYERGETQITLSFLNKVARYFEISPLHFVVGRPDNIIEQVHRGATFVHGLENGLEKEALQALKNQLREKDRQIAGLLGIVGVKARTAIASDKTAA